MNNLNKEVVYDFFDRNHIKIEKDIEVPINDNQIMKVDFKVENILFDIIDITKDDYIDSDGISLYTKKDVYKKNHIVAITGSDRGALFGKPNGLESNGLKYLKKCPQPLIGVDINLFDNPEFPYRKDRPKCFYDVRVNKQMSAHEAFFNEDIRWKMIINRVLYSGGFIDAGQVLQALNISRTCKQPSWFSKEFAKRIILKFATTDTIVDPFAGWGARCDASKELHKIYIGTDLNEELVEWHHEMGRDNIQIGDATQFKHDGICSVFICPPYQDVEVYFDSQNSELTQCDWLKICMENIPNANEYIMVCKVIDKGWEKYVVDIKTNKSHFGKNNEYIIVVPQSEKMNCIGDE